MTAALWFGMLCGLACTTVRASDAAAAAEYRIKGGYLFNLTQFIEWPVAPLSRNGRPFVIAVIDRGEATPVLENLFAGKDISGRPIEVRSASMREFPKDANILLVTRAAGVTPEEARDALGSAPTLLVGETEKFAERGGAIAFGQERGSVRLTLCHEHARANGLKVSARLATVARSVSSARGR
jgi:hypothetical protein